MADIEDVARAAGVSTATVSRALRGLPNVSDATRRKVVLAAQRLDYRISRQASSLVTGRTHTVGVVVPHVARWFFGHVIEGAEQVLRAADLDLLLYTVDDTASRDRFFTELPVKGRVDAILVLCLPLTDTHAQALRDLTIPVALVGADAEGFGSVRIDDRLGAQLAVRHLLNLGHRKIGIITGGQDTPLGFTAPHDRRAGYLDVLTAAGIEPRPHWEAPGEFTTAGGERAMTRLLASDDPPTAVFALSDEMAFGALKSLRRHRLRVPEDLSVVGFDDHDMADLLDLTTIAQPVADQGAAAAKLLLSHLDTGRSPTEPQIAPIHLVVRGSTMAPRSSS